MGIEQYLSNLNIVNTNYTAKINHLSLKLKQLKEQKEENFNKLLQQMTIEGKNFHEGYKDTLRKEFEREYGRQEYDLLEELKKLIDEMTVSLSEMSTTIENNQPEWWDTDTITNSKTI